MKCDRCGRVMAADSRFCNHCGAAVSSEPTTGSDSDDLAHAAIRASDVLDGTWRIERRIGRGGMGTVFLAHDLALDRKVAIKVLASHLCGDAQFVERFDREARLTARLEHPNIVAVYAVGRHLGRPYIVMKHLDGTTLSAHVAGYPTGLPADEMLALMRQICAGLGCIHAKGFVHRDIKAGNIFVSPDGHATILDLGILRDRSREGITRTGMMLGTPRYMSPEQAKGARDVDHRSDLYALGVLLFELITGRLPFAATDDLSLITQHATAPPPDVRERAPAAPRGASAVVARGLAKRPEDRFQSAEEMLRAIEAAYGVDAPTRPRRPGAPGVASDATDPPTVSGAAPTPARWPRVAAGAAAVGLLLAAAIVLVRAADTTEGPAAPLPAISPAPQPSASPPGPNELGPSRAPPEPEPPRTTSSPPVHLPATAPESAQAAAAQVAAKPAPTPARESPEPAPRVRERARSPTAGAGRSGSGHLRVVTTHQGEPFWASVILDGSPRGETPLALTVPAGRHRVRLERVGFAPVDRDVFVPPGETFVLRVDLEP